MTWPQPTRKDHETFCQIEQWRDVRNARGRTGTHHVTYELDLVDGRILRTRISHPVDRSDYGQSMWKHILRDQLEVSDSQFWACVKDGAKPDRGLPEPPAAALPADLVYMLLSRVGLSESEVAGMSKDEAIARLQRHWTEHT
ncbi:cytotoxic translational repressor of toxin-antitoxin stability system [Actinophytocola sp.]|uniref:cytotoxic translational repressor of toxin-antitoxin stability system n=1 Tax=Actinophytocola sp. TaxID=1872138 RepID=UPI003D6B98E8